MLNRVVIKNYRCFPDLDVTLQPLTVLIGANDSGKSSFLEAVLWFSRLMENSSNTPAPEMDLLRWRGKPEPVEITASGHFPGVGDASLSVVSSQPGQWKGGGVKSLRGFAARIRLQPTGVPATSPGRDDGEPVPLLAENGANLPTVLDYLLRKHRARFNEFEVAARAMIPGLKEVNIDTPSSPQCAIELVIDDGLRLPADHTSSGVRALLCFLALSFHPTPPHVILVEEPENSVHPRRLRDLMDLFRRMSRGEHGGPPVQFIIATHSPFALDCVKPPEDQVLVFRRLSNGARAAAPVDAERLDVFLDQFHLGEVWFNEGEDGLVSEDVQKAWLPSTS